MDQTTWANRQSKNMCLLYVKNMFCYLASYICLAKLSFVSTNTLHRYHKKSWPSKGLLFFISILLTTSYINCSGKDTAREKLSYPAIYPPKIKHVIHFHNEGSKVKEILLNLQESRPIVSLQLSSQPVPNGLEPRYIFWSNCCHVPSDVRWLNNHLLSNAMFSYLDCLYPNCVGL